MSLLDKETIAFRGDEGQKEKLKDVPNWQERFRAFADLLRSELPKIEEFW